MVNNNLRLAVQKDGRLTDGTFELLNKAGFEFEKYKNQLLSLCRNFSLEIIYVRDDDIPNYVEQGSADLGIIGRDLVIELQSKVEEILPLQFGDCKLTVGVPKDSKITHLSDLKNTKIATSYPNSTREYFDKKGIAVDIVNISGSVEVAPAIGVADAIADITSSGASMRLNDLRPLETIFKSEAILISSPKVRGNKKKLELLNLMLTRFKAVLAAKQYKYVMLNLPKEALKNIRELIPGLKSPTVIPLADKDWVAVHSVIKEEIFWEVVERLKKAGAQGILVTPIEKLIV